MGGYGSTYFDDIMTPNDHEHWQRASAAEQGREVPFRIGNSRPRAGWVHRDALGGALVTGDLCRFALSAPNSTPMQHSDEELIDAVVAALQAENRAHHWGGPDHPATSAAKDALRDAFAPPERDWRDSVVPAGMAIVQRAIESVFASDAGA